MTQPLALVYYAKLMPGSQLVNRLQDLQYRVQAVTDLSSFQLCAQTEGPLVVFMDLEPKGDSVCQIIAALKADPRTKHIPVIAFSSERAVEQQAAAQKAGAALAASDTALFNHLQEFLERALQVG